MRHKILSDFTIRWNLDSRKTYYTKNLEYVTSFEEISVLFNEKILKIQKLKSKMPDSKGKAPQDTNCTATCLLSQKLSKLDEPDMRDTAGEAGTSS